jgi:hypothetical protein
MKNRECMQKEFDPEILDIQLSAIGNGKATRKPFRNFRKMLFIVSIAGIGLLFNACVAGYVESEPSYMVVSRPPQPSNVHIWIDGGWGWSNQSHGYVKKTGYWDRPRDGQRYVSGYWQSSPKGKYWENGHWEKHNDSNGRYKK